MKSHLILLFMYLIPTFVPNAVLSAEDRPPDEDSPPVEKPPKGFLDAYRRAGSPRLLIYGHMLKPGDNDVAHLKSFQGRVRPYFIHREVTTLIESQTQFRNAPAFENLVQTNALAAAQLVSREIPADVVILFTFEPQSGRPDGVQYVADYSIVDVNRGTIFGTHSWEIKPAKNNRNGLIDVQRWQQYGEALAVKITEDFKNFYGSQASSLFTVKLMGIPGSRAKAVRDALKEMRGVARIVRERFTEGNSETELDYSGGAIDLLDSASEAVSLVLDDHIVSPWVGQEGWILLQAHPLPPPPPPMAARDCQAMLNGDPPNDGNKKGRDRFENAYAKEGFPQIGVMINKEYAVPRDPPAADQENSQNKRQAGGNGQKAGKADNQIQICVNCPVAKGGDGQTVASPPANQNEIRTPTDDEFLNTTEMENHVFGQFLGLDAKCINLAAERGNLKQEQKLQKDVYGELELARLLGDKAGVEIVVSGVGKVMRFPNDVEIRFTFRAFRWKTAAILATATVNRRLANNQFNNIGQALKDMAAEVTGQLACQML